MPSVAPDTVVSNNVAVLHGDDHLEGCVYGEAKNF